jgi:hypothetical protein
MRAPLIRDALTGDWRSGIEPLPPPRPWRRWLSFAVLVLLMLGAAAGVVKIPSHFGD